MTASSSPATFTCRKARRPHRLWSPCTAAAGSRARAAFQYWGPYLASRGIAVFSISYRLATKGKMFPQAVQDVLAGVQFVRGKAGPNSASTRNASD
jgi:acetyl esterase/lipase